MAFSHYHGNYFPEIFSPCFKLGQNLSSCQVSEKSTHRFGQNDGTNIRTYRQTSPFIYIYSLVVEALKRGEPRKNLKKADFGTIRKQFFFVE